MEANRRLQTCPAAGATLPDELLSYILECLPAGARVRFRAVCRRWNLLPPARRAPLPWLLTHVPPVEEGENRSAGELVMSFYCPWERRMYEIPGLVGSACCFKVVGSSPDGAWLLYVDGDGVINAVHVPSGERVQAPSRRGRPGRYANCICRRAIIFFPSDSSSSSSLGGSGTNRRRGVGFTIVALFDQQDLAFTRDEDTSWTGILSRLHGIPSLRHMLLHEGSLYLANDRGQALRVDGLVGGNGATPSWTFLPSWSPRIPPERKERAETAGPNGRMPNINPTTYLSGFGGGVWQIWGSPSRAVFTANTMGVGFARLDLSRAEWDDTTAEIGDYAAFLGNGHSLVYSTHEFPVLSSGRIRLDGFSEFTPPVMFGKPQELAWGDNDRPQPSWVVPDVY